MGLFSVHQVFLGVEIFTSVNIAKGKKLYESGAKDMSATSIKIFVNGSIKASENRLRSIPASSIKMPCRAVGKRFMY